jgi:hypothetical protein
MIVTLEDFEMDIANFVGHRRQEEAEKKGLPDKHGFEGGTAEGTHIHCCGAVAEFAVGKALDIHWGGSVNTFKRGGDVGHFQVRYRSQEHYQLIVRADDRDEDIFILVRGTPPTLDVVGWLTGKDAKNPEWVRRYGGRPPAFFVPDDQLKPTVDLLKQYLKDKFARVRECKSST